MSKIILIMVFLLLLGCSAKQNSIIKTEYQQVLIPVVYKMNKPPRPVFLDNKSTPIHISELLIYVEMLETLINEHSDKESIKSE